MSFHSHILHNSSTTLTENQQLQSPLWLPKKAMTLKPQSQSTHPASDKFINLVNNARIPWSNNIELKEEIQKIIENCSICRIYRKTAPRSVLGLAKATLFQETVAMDFKFYHRKMYYVSLIFILDYLSQPLFWIKTLISSSRLSLQFGSQFIDLSKNSEQITEENSHTMNIYNSVKA